MAEKKADLLNSLYKNASMGTSSIRTVLPNVKNPQLRRELKTQLETYQDSCRQLHHQIHSVNEKSGILERLTQTYADAGIVVSTLLDSSSSHIAEMMIQGTNMGIVEITKSLNSDSSTTPELKTQAENMLKNQQAYIDKLKYYL